MSTPNTSPDTSPRLAKLTPPRISQVYARDRLFKQLDEARESSVLWLGAPAGSGKTTLVASYLQKRGQTPLWYQIDEGDADLASFFYYMGQLAQTAAPNQPELPLLTPEYLLGLPTFSRNFFRSFFACIPIPGVLVLDNFQDAGEQAALHQVLPVILAEIPVGIRVILISRTDPIEAVIRLRATGTMRVMDFDDLRLRDEESVGISHVRFGKHSMDGQLIHELNHYTQGWITGLVLQLEQLGKRSLPEELKQSNPQLIFDYFAEEIFHGLEDTTQRFLLRLAFLPKISLTAAQKLNPEVDAGAILEQLTQRNYFTVRQEGQVPAYEFHPLFRAFLQARAKKYFKDEALEKLFSDTAKLLAEEGAIEHAIDCAMRGNDSVLATKLILPNAQRFVAQGRSMTVATWIQELPMAIRIHEPWLHYWLGICTIGQNPLSTIHLMEQAFVKFEDGQDVVGMYLTVSGALDAIWLSNMDQRPADGWIDQFEDLQAKYPDPLPPEIEVRVLTSVLRALFWRQPYHPKHKQWVRLAENLFNHECELSARLQLGGSISFESMFNDLRKAVHISTSLASLIKNRHLEPFSEIYTLLVQSYIALVSGNPEDTLRLVHTIINVADNNGIQVLHQLAYGAGSMAALIQSDIKQADQFIRNAQSGLAHLPVNLDSAHIDMISSWRYLLTGELEFAEAHILSAVEITRQFGAVYPESLSRYCYAHILFEKQEYELATLELEKSRDILHCSWMEYQCCLVEAYYLRQQQLEEVAVTKLSQALTIGKQQGNVQPLFYRPHIMSSLCAMALEYKIETDYVSSVIRKRELLPPKEQAVPENWPLPIKLYTLGCFRLTINDETMLSKGKGQKKPLDVLRAIVVYGGRDVNAQRLAEAVWPDADGDAAYQSMKTAVKRLRKLVGIKEAISLCEGKLSLDPRYVWVDVWAFEQASVKNDIASLRSALELYQDAFMQGEDQSIWISAREHWRAKVIDVVGRLGELCEQSGDYNQAISVYRHGLEIDSLEEAFFRGLMRCFLLKAEPSVVIKLYEQCTIRLQRELNIQPSEETEALAKQAANSSQSNSWLGVHTGKPQQNTPLTK